MPARLQSGRPAPRKRVRKKAPAPSAFTRAVQNHVAPRNPTPTRTVVHPDVTMRGDRTPVRSRQTGHGGPRTEKAKASPGYRKSLKIARKAGREYNSPHAKLKRAVVAGLVPHARFHNGRYELRVSELAGLAHHWEPADVVRTPHPKGLKITAGNSTFVPHAGSGLSLTQAKVDTLHHLGNEKIIAPGLKVLAQTTRPAHAVAGLALEGTKGFKRGLIGNKPYSFSQVLKRAGAPKLVQTVGGFGLDVATDPTTYATFGAGGVAKEAAAKAAYKAALKKGGESAARKAAKAAYKAGSQRGGLSIGVRAKVPFGPRFAAKTSGRATATIARKTGLKKVTTGVRNTPVVQATGKALAPDFRPKGVPQEAHSAYLAAKRTKAHAIRTETRRAENRVRAVRHATRGKGEGKRLVHARERARAAGPPTRKVTRTVTGGVPLRERADALTPRRVRVVAHDESASFKAALRHIAKTDPVRAARERKLSQKIAGEREHLFNQDFRSVQQERELRTLVSRAAAQRRRVGLPARPEVYRPERLAERTRRAHLGPRTKPTVRETATLEYPKQTPAGLPSGLRQTEAAFGKEMDRIAARETKAGILGARRANYVPKIPHEDLSTPSVGGRVKTGRGLNPHAKKSKTGTIQATNAARVARGEKPMFSEDPALILAQRASTSANKVADSEYLARLAKIGREHKPGEGVAADHMLYTISPHGFKPLEKKVAGQATGQMDAKAAEAAHRGGEKVVALPKAIGDMELAVRSRPARSDWARWYDRAIGGMKTTLTVANVPTYDLRNLYGDLEAAFRAGTSAADVAKGFKLAARHGRVVRGERKIAGPQVAEHGYLKEARQLGVIDTGHTGGELYDRARATQKTGITAGRRGPIERLRTIGTYRENAVRLGTYMSGRKRGLSPEQARDHSNRFHIDYTELTPQEEKIRRLVPFYTFTARNTRNQISSLFHTPGKAATVQKVLETSARAAGYGSYADFAQHLNEAQQRGIPIPLRIGGTVVPLYPSLPTTDLNRIPFVNAAGGAIHGHITGKQLIADLRTMGDLGAQTVNPALKAVVELGANHSFFFGGPIYRTDAHPEAPGDVPAPGGILRTVGIHPAKTLDKQTGKMVDAWPAWVDYLARLAPQGGTVAQLGTDARGSRGQSHSDALISRLSGVKVGHLDPTKEKVNALYQELGHLKVQAQNLKDQGKAYTAGTKNLPMSQREHLPGYQRVLDKTSAINHQINAIDVKAGRVNPRGAPAPKKTPQDLLREKYGHTDATKKLKKKYGGGSELERLKAKYGG